MRHQLALVLVLALLWSICSAEVVSLEEDDEENFSHVTCGSAVKLKHVSSGYHLHSHDIQWGSGSKQQSVTAFKAPDDPNSLWSIRAAYQSRPCHFGDLIPCGTTIRLVHVATGKLLHSHLHRSPLSKRQEVSGYGDYFNDEGDTGDNWALECVDDHTGAAWERGKSVRLKHKDTGKYLYTGKDSEFTQRNCRNCPIVGQLEISAHTLKTWDSNYDFATDNGIYFPSTR